MKKITNLTFLTLILVLGLIPFSHSEEITTCTEINGAGNDSGYYYLTGNISGGNQTDGLGTVSCILVSVSNIRINCQGNTIDGNSSAGYAINIDGGGALTNVSIENCRITGTNSGVAQSSLQYSNFTNNTIAVSGTYAMSTTGTGYNNYTDNTIPGGTSYYGIFHGISIGPSSFINNNVSSEYGLFLNGVSDQQVIGGRYNVGSANAIELAGSSDIFITNTTLSSAFGIGLKIKGGSGNTIDNVTISGATFGASISNTQQNAFNNIVVTGSGMNFVSANNNSITNSTIANSTEVGIALQLGEGNNITNNTIEGNDYYGIRTSENNTLILNNTFSNNADASAGSGASIKLNGSADVNITQNRISATDGYAIVGENTTSESNIWIINNTIENNSIGGIQLFNQLTMLTIRNNTVRNNPIGISANVSSQAINFANGTIEQNIIENATEIGIYSNYNLTNITNNSITKSAVGLIVANTTIGRLNSNHYYNNTHDLIINNTATSSVNATNETFDNPSGDRTNFTSLDLIHQPSSQEAFQIDWALNELGNPSSANTVANKYINITNLSATFTINSMSFDYAEADETNETYFTIFRYDSGAWTQISTTINATNNKAQITNITSAGVYALFDYQTVAAPTPQSSEPESHNQNNQIRYQLNHESECGNNTVRISVNRGEKQNVHIFIIQNDQTIIEGNTDENGQYNYYLNEDGQVQIRIGSSTFFGPFSIEYCQNNQTQNQTVNQETQEEIDESDQERNQETAPTQTIQTTEQTNQDQPQIQETQTIRNTTNTIAQTQNQAKQGQGATTNNQGELILPIGIGLILIIIMVAGIYYFFLRKR